MKIKVLCPFMKGFCIPVTKSFRSFLIVRVCAQHFIDNQTCPVFGPYKKDCKNTKKPN